MTLRILATGGTFDKRYDPASGVLGFGDSNLPRLLRQARVTAPVTLEVLMLIDSLDMVDGDRVRILDACRAAPEPAIVVVHGTDTMSQSAAVLAAARLPKTIVLTGAMVPCTLENSDALFNLGHAMGCAQHRPAGVWIAMHGTCWSWDAVRKDRARGVFEARVQGAADAADAGGDAGRATP